MGNRETHKIGFFHRIGLVTQRLWPAIADLAGNEVYVLASAIAFNALLSFFPFAILLLVICRSVLGWHQGYEVLLELLRDAYLPVAQDFIVRNLRNLTGQFDHNSGLALLSLGALAFTSSGIFAPIELALNRTWKVARPRSAVRSRALALGLVLGCGVLALVSVLVAASTRSLLRQSLGSLFGFAVTRFFVSVVIKLLSLPITIAIFFLIYYCLPNRRVPVLRVLPAAICVGTIWEAARYLFAWCLPMLNFESVYGAFYVTVSLVMWAFVSALLLLLGANLSSLNVEQEAG